MSQAPLTEEKRLHPADSDYERGFRDGESRLQDRANAWHEVFDLLRRHNPTFTHVGNSGKESALKEIRRLQNLDVPENTHGR